MINNLSEEITMKNFVQRKLISLLKGISVPILCQAVCEPDWDLTYTFHRSMNHTPLTCRVQKSWSLKRAVPSTQKIFSKYLLGRQMLWLLSSTSLLEPTTPSSICLVGILKHRGRGMTYFVKWQVPFLSSFYRQVCEWLVY